jgi:thioredoxin 1
VAANPSSEQHFKHWISTGITLVDFNAPWCKPCRAQESIIKAIEKDFQGRAKVTTVNIDDYHEVAFKLGIQSIPTTIIYKDGREINRFIGLQTAGTLKRALRKLIHQLN